MDIIIYSSASSPRLEYTLDLVFRTLLQLDYRLTHDVNVFQQAELPKINYSQQPLSSREIFIPSGHLLFEPGINRQELAVFEHFQLKAFFRSNLADTDLPFDLFGMIFYLVSRYEEYTSPKRDQHQRFPAGASVAFKHQFLQQPLVNQWTLVLLKLLKSKYPNLPGLTPKFELSVTYDVDLAWAYLHRPLWRHLGSYASSLIRGDFKGLKNRLSVQLGQKPDPFFTFPYLEQLHTTYQIEPKYFFLLGDYGPFDKNIPPYDPALHQLIKSLFPKATFIGIHPSYQSNSDPEKLTKEIQRLEKIIGQAVIHSRQHFLKLELPNTYRRLIEAGIRHDYSMGYASQIGFRASIATPFKWYDLETESATALTIYPFQVMDVTLKEYLQLRPDEALEYVKPLVEACKKVGGQFCTLWHNSSFSQLEGWEAWKPVYEKLLRSSIA